VRNSSLVERLCAEDLPGLSMIPKLRTLRSGRGAFYTRRRYTVRSAGVYRSENAGVSNECR
jgi:hypothetical protein